MSKIIIITGGIASGKTTLLNYLRSCGFPVLNADSLVHEYYKSKEGVEKISSNFGKEFIKNGEVDRKSLGNLVFQNKTKLKILEKIVHIAIIELLVDWLTKNKKEDFVFLELAQYFEMDQSLLKEIDIEHVILLVADKERRISFLKERNGILREEALRRIQAQWPDEKKIDLADFVIKNNGTKKDLIRQAENILQRI